MPKHKSNIIPFRRIAAIAACLVLVFSFATSANAFCFRDVWNAVVTWAQETFSFSMGVEVSEPVPNDEFIYSSLADALSKDGRNSKILPTWIPEGYEQIDIIIDRNPIQESYLAIYSNGESRLKISIHLYLSTSPEQIETSDTDSSVYSISGIDYYLFSNHDQNRAAWIVESYECCISGEIEMNDLILMIESIGKG